jgi:MFS-type transporter involved in bile tolerance (Atg22 family)
MVGRRERLGWYCYDWANSAFSTTVVTVLLGPYLTTAAQPGGDVEGWIFPLGLRVATGGPLPVRRFTVGLARARGAAKPWADPRTPR